MRFYAFVFMYIISVTYKVYSCNIILNLKIIKTNMLIVMNGIWCIVITYS